MRGDQEGTAWAVGCWGCGSLRQAQGRLFGDAGPATSTSSGQAHHERLSRRNVGGGGCLYWRGEGRGRLSGGAVCRLKCGSFSWRWCGGGGAVARILPPTGPTCTRCEGSGSVNERWPDPSKPGGWHELSGSARSATGRGGCVADGLTPGRGSRVTLIGEPRRPLRRPFSSRTLTLTSPRGDLCLTRGAVARKTLTQPSPPGEGLRGGCADQRDVPTGGTEPGRPLTPTLSHSRRLRYPRDGCRKTLTLPSPPGEGLRGGALLVGLVLAPTVSCKGTSPGMTPHRFPPRTAESFG